MDLRMVDCEATSVRLKKMFEEHGFTMKDIQIGLELESVQAVYKCAKIVSNYISKGGKPIHECLYR